MKYLFSERKYIEKRIKRAKSILLVCDFDGTLVDIKPAPHMVRLPQETKKILSLLARDKKKIVGVLSGRSLSDIRKLVRLGNIFYAGNHGFEIKLPKKKKFVHPKAKEMKSLLKTLVKKLKKDLTIYKGLLIEDKIYGLSIHYRNCLNSEVANLKRDIRRICLPLIKKAKIKISEGKKVIEVRPPVDWNKGKALLWIEDKLKKNKALTIYLGDDMTDEDVFTQMKNGLSIYVGKRNKYSKAKFYLTKPSQTVDFLKLLTEL